jgi:hypothetical protein
METAKIPENGSPRRVVDTDRALPLAAFPDLIWYQQTESASGASHERADDGTGGSAGTVRGREDENTDEERPRTAQRRNEASRTEPTTTSTHLTLVVAQRGYSYVAHRDRHLFHMVPLTPQEITKGGLDGKPLADEIWVRMKFGFMWYWPVKAKGPYEDEPTCCRMLDLVLRGLQFPHVNVQTREYGFTGRMPSGEELKFHSPSNGVVIIPWPLQFVSPSGIYAGPLGAPGRDGHRFSPFTDFRFNLSTPLQAQAIARLHDCGAVQADLEFLVMANRQRGPQDLVLPWLQAALLGMISPIHLKQRITGQLGRDYVGPIVQPTENIRSFSRESGCHVPPSS